jgi:hypothetical protein
MIAPTIPSALVRLPSGSEREREIHRQLAHENALAWKKLYNNSKDPPSPPLFWFAKSGIDQQNKRLCKATKQSLLKKTKWNEGDGRREE